MSAPRETKSSAPSLRKFNPLFIVFSLLSVVRTRGHAATAPSPVGMEKLAAWFVDALVSMSAEEIALRLQQVRGQTRRSVAIVKCQRGGKRRGRHTESDSANDSLSPGLLIFV